MKTLTISTKEIRDDLEGFLKRLKGGQTIQVMYRSRPLVTLTAQIEQDAYEASDAGTPAAIRRSVRLAQSLDHRQPVLDPDKSFIELYEETR